MAKKNRNRDASKQSTASLKKIFVLDTNVLAARSDERVSL